MVVCSPTDGTLVATGGGDDKGFLWKIGQGDWAFELQGHSYHTEGLTCLTITSDSTLALTGSKDIPVHIVNITTGKVRNSTERCKIWSKNSRTLCFKFFNFFIICNHS
ncbi:angio-associated migratory cell protein-like [Camellia sinensis]|uniref:angio-associated migratory cell protein-like n=1 Tax=Camellia sinensis TaxID=4442 RepID=UPI001036E082|nr:angio-associated migratory cell protein-like [Camellia sinensis]XP_028065332.1 angio-associated migratory cell protein-like [Camellia sinensis]